MEPRLLTLSAEALPGYDACLRDVLALLDRVSVQPAIAHAPALRLVLEDRAAMLPGLRAALCPLPAARVVTGPRAPEADAPALASCDATEPPAPIQAATADARLARKRERQAAWKRAKVARLRAEQAGEAGQAEPARRPRKGGDPEHLAKMNAARSQQAAARREAQQTAEADHVPDTTEMVEGAPTIKQDMKVATPATIEPGLTVAPEPATLNPWASTSPYRLTADAEAEALDMLRAGQGAKALHEEFGGRLEWWQAWAARARQAGRAA